MAEALRRLRRSGAGRRGPASDGVGGSGGAQPPGKKLSGAGERGEGGVARLHVDVSAVYLLDLARAPPDTITDSAALLLPEAV